MTEREFRSLSRGDIIRAVGNGCGVVESALFHGDVFKITLRLQDKLGVVKDVAETDREMFESVRRLR